MLLNFTDVCNSISIPALASAAAHLAASQILVASVGPATKLVKHALVLVKIHASHALRLISMSSILPCAFKRVLMDIMKVRNDRISIIFSINENLYLFILKLSCRQRKQNLCTVRSQLRVVPGSPRLLH